MATVLDEIIQHKRKEVAELKSLYPTKLLERSPYFETPPLSLKKYLLREDLSGIIAEFKRKSPSKGMINEYADVEKITLGYMQAGASALSILTDRLYFGGSNEDLITARKFNFCPILRKDFTVDEYQIVEAKSIGADAILLIASALTPAEVKSLASFAQSLGLEVLLELHDESELGHIPNEDVLIGINNRNLKTMTTDVANSLRMKELLPPQTIKITESGINNVETLAELKKAGFNGFLIGEYFMTQPRPQAACKKLIAELKIQPIHA